MARSIRNSADYFPHFVLPTDALSILEYEHGNDGYVFWYRLQESLANAENHCLDFSYHITAESFVVRCRLQHEQVWGMLDRLAAMDVINRELWERSQVIWIDELVQLLKPLYKSRGREVPKKPRLERKHVRKADEHLSRGGNSSSLQAQEELGHDEVPLVQGSESEAPQAALQADREASYIDPYIGTGALTHGYACIEHGNTS